jgi:hypothetical protein
MNILESLFKWIGIERKHKKRDEDRSKINELTKQKIRERIDKEVEDIKAKAELASPASIIASPLSSPKVVDVHLGKCPKCGEYGRLNVYEIPPDLVLCARCDIEREWKRDK